MPASNRPASRGFLWHGQTGSTAEVSGAEPVELGLCLAGCVVDGCAGGAEQAVQILDDLGKPGGFVLSVPDQHLDAAQGDEFGEAAIGPADHEDLAASGVDATGVRAQGHLGGVRAGRHPQRRDPQLGQQRHDRGSVVPSVSA